MSNKNVARIAIEEKDKPVSVNDCVPHITHINYEGGKTILKTDMVNSGSGFMSQTNSFLLDSSPIVKIEVGT